jgi:hypothetical protein
MEAGRRYVGMQQDSRTTSRQNIRGGAKINIKLRYQHNHRAITDASIKITSRSYDLKALFWLKGALHKRADHATWSSVGQLKHIVDETWHCCTSLRIDIRREEGNTQANRRQIGGYKALERTQVNVESHTS